MTITDKPTSDLDRGVLDEEVVVAPTDVEDRAKFDALVKRLSAQSVTKHYDAYDDIPWDDPVFAVDPDDPRWILPVDDTLGSTEWYRSQPAAVKSRIGLYRYASAAKLGMEFENVLTRGLLEFTLFKLPNNDPSFRYVYHEVAEETHHGMMFQEFVNRSGMDIKGMPLYIKLVTQRVVLMGRRFPPLFFFFVLGGEDPIDHFQREILRGERELPPIFEIIMRHHVTEEARHLSFARHYLKLSVPKIGRVRRLVLSIATPIILGIMAQMMILPPTVMAKEFGIPESVMDEAYKNNAQLQTNTVEAVRKVRRLARELKLMNPLARRIWQRLGIYAED
jgi:hypothetical protein